VPELDPKNPSTSLQNNSTKVKVDFLTSSRGSTKPVLFEDLGIAAQPLKFMDYLLAGQPIKGLVIGSYAIPVNLPDPARFAIHKLIVSQERAPHVKSKSQKDIAQAEVLLDYLVNENPGQVIDSLSACLTIQGAIEGIKNSLPALGMINEGVKNFLLSNLSGHSPS
jgi:hypothetical protein